eukprot:2667994-Pleurochrysis_carterae.AAC.1
METSGAARRQGVSGVADARGRRLRASAASGRRDAVRRRCGAMLLLARASKSKQSQQVTKMAR